jgi:hypothetical protein
VLPVPLNVFGNPLIARLLTGRPAGTRVIARTPEERPRLLAALV